MSVVAVSPRYEVVIPEAARESLKITPGEQLRVLCFEDRLELIPIRLIQTMRGFLRGMDTRIEREGDRL